MSEKTWTIKWQYIEIDGKIINGDRNNPCTFDKESQYVEIEGPITNDTLLETFNIVSNSLLELLMSGEIHAFNSIRVLPNVEA